MNTFKGQNHPQDGLSDSHLFGHDGHEESKDGCWDDEDGQHDGWDTL